jgi:hypothetical protein
MDLILFLIVIAGMGYLGYRLLNKESPDGKHPLDSVTPAPYKIEPPAATPEVAPESTPIQPVISNVLDVNKDGKVNLEDAKEAVKETKEKAKKVAAKVKEKADINKDGKVNVADAKAAAKKAKEKVKKATSKK